MACRNQPSRVEWYVSEVPAIVFIESRRPSSMDELSERDLILGTVMETLYAGGPRSDGIHYFEDGVPKRSWEH